MIVWHDLGSVLPNIVWLIRKLILSNGLFGSVARVATCLCAAMNDNWGLGQFPLFRQTAFIFSAFSVVIIRYFNALFSPSSSRLFISPFSCLFFICCYFLSLSPCLTVCSLFLSASPPLRCQHFTVDIQLLAGHSIVIPFRAAPFSVGPSNSHSNYNPGCLRSWRSANCCFQTFLGPPPNLIPQI